MGDKLVTVLVAIIGLATLAVIVSRQANTSGVIKAGGNAFTDALKAAISPVTGGGSGVGMNGFTPQF
jgi:hypothetical protein